VTPRYQRHADIRLTDLAGEGVVLHLGSRSYFTVTETGLVILEALKEPRTFDELVAAILAEYEVEQAHAERSVQAFLDRCLLAEVVRTVST
jgi:predicted transcriptional regulator